MLVVAVLGLGLGPRPQPSTPRVAEPGVRGGPGGPVAPGQHPEEELPLRGEGEDSQDAKDPEDPQRKRAPGSVLALAPGLELRLIAAVTRLRLRSAHHGEPECTHGSRLHNRGPPVV